MRLYMTYSFVLRRLSTNCTVLWSAPQPGVSLIACWTQGPCNILYCITSNIPITSTLEKIYSQPIKMFSDETRSWNCELLLLLTLIIAIQEAKLNASDTKLTSKLVKLNSDKCSLFFLEWLNFVFLCLYACYYVQDLSANTHINIYMIYLTQEHWPTFCWYWSL